VNIASPENAAKSGNSLVYGRKGKMHMVKATLPKLQPKRNRKAQFTRLFT